MTISLNPTENLFDPALNRQDYVSISLSVELSLNHLSFCITDNIQQKYLAVVSYKFPEKVSAFGLSEFLSKLFEYEPLLKKNYKNIIISYACNLSTLIPEEIFDENLKKSYLNFFSNDLEDKLIIADYVPELKLYSIFALPKCINTVLQNNFSKFKIIHSHNAFFRSVYANSFQIDSLHNKVFVDVESHSFEVCIFQNNKLLIDNSFDFKTKEDFLYYLLFVLKQLHIDPHKISLILSGKITDNSSVYNLLNKYIANISFMENKSACTLSDYLTNLSYQEYFKLLNQIKCV